MDVPGNHNTDADLIFADYAEQLVRRNIVHAATLELYKLLSASDARGVMRPRLTGF